MAQQSILAGQDLAESRPRVNKLDATDLRDALRLGYEDFSHKPSHAIFLTLIYPIVSFLLIQTAAGRDLLPLIYPLIAGFALLGPLAAVGLYEMSRQREHGEDMHWRHAFRVFRSPALANIVTLGAVLAALFLLWLYTAQALHHWVMGGTDGETPSAFVTEILTTERGWLLILLGNAVGFLFACLVLAISVVSFPMLLDRNVDLATAVKTSVQVTLKNPAVIARWGLIVAFGLAIGFLPLGIGLAITLPILGHATWHLYRRAVAS